jgi:hypothetical protein
LPEWETVRFEECSATLFNMLHSSDYKIKEPERGIIYGDVSLNKEITVFNDILVKYEGALRADNTQVQILTVKIPDKLDIFNIPNFSEAVACLLSFSFRSRFTGSRHWSLHKEGRPISPPMDAFYRMSSVVAGHLAVHPLSPDAIGEGISLLDWLVNELKRLGKKDFRRMMRSLRLYQLSLLTYSMDVGLAYSLLVASVDNLSCRLYVSETKKYTERFVKFIMENLPAHTLTSFDSRAWEEDRWMESITPWKHSIIDSYRERYETDGEKALESLEGVLNTKVIERIKETFDARREIPSEEKRAYDHVLSHWYLYRLDSKLTREELPGVLKQIYQDVRSAFFHGGKTPSQSTVDRYETAPIRPKFIGNNKIKWQRETPSFYYFERIAHESIMGYLPKLKHG